jgi:hypothetical protein
MVVIDLISITSLFLYLVPHGVDFVLLLFAFSPLAYSYSFSFRGEVVQSPKFVVGFSLVDMENTHGKIQLPFQLHDHQTQKIHHQVSTPFCNLHPCLLAKFYDKE